MANYSAIKAAVNGYIKQNGRKEITGKVLNAVLNAVIDSLGRYFQFAGGAMPSDDPGTPDQNVCYLATEPGLYVHFNNIRINNEEVALLFWNGEWVKQTIAIGIQEVNASVDNQVGTPSVDVNYSNGRLVLTFHNLKGGKGDTGDPAGFGTIGADITGGVGIPGVSVETSGDNAAKNMMFHFTNLKGETGVSSVVATIDDTSGTPSCQVSLVNGVLTLEFSGLKGLKGDTGVSADYPITIYNGLDSDATDQALAAAQGKVLDGKISQIQKLINRNYTPGSYLNTSGNPVSDADWGYSDFIPYTPGNDVVWKWDDNYANYPIACMVLYKADKSVRDYYVATGASTQNGGRLFTASQIGSATAFIRISFLLGTDSYLKINGVVAWSPDAGIKEKADAVPGMQGEISDLKEGIIIPIYSLTSGSINVDGSIGTSQNYSYTSAIQLKKGQKISVYSQGYGYAAISEYGTPFVPLVSVQSDPGAGVYVTSEYVAPSDMQVACCVRSANKYRIYIDGEVKDLERRIYGEIVSGVSYVSDINSSDLAASGTQCSVSHTPNTVHKLVFFPVSNGRSYKIHVNETLATRIIWGWCNSYLNQSPETPTNIGGLIGTEIGDGNPFDKVVTNDGNFPYIVISYAANSGGVTCEEFVSGDVVGYFLQGKSSTEKKTARDNIGAASRQEMESISIKAWNSQIEGKGQVYSSRKFFGFIPGHTYRVYFRNPSWDISGISGDSNYKLVIRNDYNGDYTLLVGVYIPGEVAPYYDIQIPQNSDYVTIGGRAVVGTYIEFSIEDITDTFIGWHDQTIFSINHRGYSLVAPENTLPAFILSKKRGFAYVETDVAFTSDNVAVLMHDETINRTGRNPDGTAIGTTINIYDITYAEALQYDFGIWMGAEWAGTPIPTFAEFIQLCKQLSIHPFIELKNSITWTEERCNIVAEAIKAVGMERDVSFISFDVDALRYMTAIFPEATIGLGYQDVYDAEHFTAFVNSAVGLRTATNRVLISVRYSSMYSSLYEIAKTAGINSIVWTVNSQTDATTLNENTVGVLSDSLNAGALILGKLFASLPFGV